MANRDLTVYRASTPAALAAWHATADAREKWANQMTAFLAEHGFGERSVYVAHTGRVLGVQHIDGEEIPDAWRLDARTGYLMPRLTKRAGRLIDARLNELIQPDPRDAMPGMPKTCSVSLALLTCGLELIHGALYATWSLPIPDDQVDLAVWERLKLSEYYAVLEREDERKATCCRCDPAACEADEAGDHCVTSGCAYCLNGCPATDRPCCKEPQRVTVARADLRRIVEVAAAYLDMCEPPPADDLDVLKRLRLATGDGNA